MTALYRYIDDLVNGKDPEDDFPKNESSWEELFFLCKRLINEIVTLRRAAAHDMSHVPDVIDIVLKDMIDKNGGMG